MKVVDPGLDIEAPYPHRATCPHCRAELEYHDSDIAWPPSIAYQKGEATDDDATARCGHCGRKFSHYKAKRARALGGKGKGTLI